MLCSIVIVVKMDAFLFSSTLVTDLKKLTHLIFTEAGSVLPSTLQMRKWRQEREMNLSQFSHSVMSNSLRPHELQHARPPCPSPTPGVHPNPRPSSRWCHPIISSSVVPFSSCPQSFPASGSFQMSQLFAWGGPKYWSFSFNISPTNEHPGLISFRMDGLDLLAVQGTLKSLLQHHSLKASVLRCSAFLMSFSLQGTGMQK